MVPSKTPALTCTFRKYSLSQFSTILLIIIVGDVGDRSEVGWISLVKPLTFEDSTRIDLFLVDGRTPSRMNRLQSVVRSGHITLDITNGYTMA